MESSMAETLVLIVSVITALSFGVTDGVVVHYVERRMQVQRQSS